MGALSGKYSRNPFSAFDEQKRYAAALVQEGIPWVDADENDSRLAAVTAIRRVQQLFGDGSPNDGLKVVGTGATNDFTIKGGTGSLDGAGSFFLKGLRCLLVSDIAYVNNGADEGKRSIHSRWTKVTYESGPDETVLEDSAANYVVNELASRNVRLDIEDGTPTDVAVVSNTANEIRVSGDQTSNTSAGKHYFIHLSTPSGSDRTDGVFLNVYLDEYDGGDDPNIKHSVGGQSIEAQRRLKLIQSIFVREGSTTFGDYVDSDGYQHYLFRIATLYRENGVATVDADMVVDERPIIGLGREDVLRSEIKMLRPRPRQPEDDYLYVEAGLYQKQNGKGYVSFAGGQIQINPITANPRYTVVWIDDSGILQALDGSEAGSPTVPDLPDTGLSIAVVYVDETAGTVIIEDSDITDIRPFLTPDMNARRLQDRPLNDAAPTTGDGIVWDGSQWVPTPASPGWKLKLEISSDPALSAVTVGEAGCDFTDLASAIAYVSGKTPTKDMQFAIYIFEKRSGQDWSFTSQVTVPDYTHLIGMGKVTFKFGTFVPVGSAVTLGVFSSLQNIRVEIGDRTSISTSAIDLTSDDSWCENVEVSWTDATPDYSKYGFSMTGNRTKLFSCKSWVNAATANGRCSGVRVDGDYCFVHDIEIRGVSGSVPNYGYGIRLSATAIGGFFSNVLITGDTLSYFYGISAASSASYCDFKNVRIEIPGSTTDDVQSIEMSSGTCIRMTDVYVSGTTYATGPGDYGMFRNLVFPTTANHVLRVRGGSALIEGLVIRNTSTWPVDVYVAPRARFCGCTITASVDPCIRGMGGLGVTSEDVVISNCILNSGSGQVAVTAIGYHCPRWTGSGNVITGRIDPTGSMDWSIGVEWTGGSDGTGETAWTATTGYAPGSIVRRTVHTAGDLVFVCVSGTTSGAVQPTWPTVAGAVSALDGDIRWMAIRTYAPGVVYQAPHDLLVVARAVVDNDGIEGYTDSNPAPSTLVAASSDADANENCTITFPVKKDDYWKVVAVGTPAVVIWTSALPGANNNY